MDQLLNYWKSQWPGCLTGFVIGVAATYTHQALNFVIKRITACARFQHLLWLLGMLLFIGCIYFWLLSWIMKLVITPILALLIGIAVGSRGLQSRLSLFQRRDFRTSKLSRIRKWNDELCGDIFESDKWRIHESVPNRMLVPTPEGARAEWGKGTLMGPFHESGFIEAKLELDVGDYQVTWKSKADSIGTGWDPGAGLTKLAEPHVRESAAIRFMPAGSGDPRVEVNSLCFLIDGKIKHNWPVKLQSWVSCMLEISGGKARATVDGSQSQWEYMPDHPLRLIVGPFPADWEASGSFTLCSFKDIELQKVNYS